MFSNDNYYNSAVFSTLSLNFGLNASFITIPNKSSLSNVSMTVDDNYDMTNENGVMTTNAGARFITSSRKRSKN